MHINKVSLYRFCKNWCFYVLWLQFFKPLNPVSVCIHYNSEGRASGEADVDFGSYHELSEAMKRDRGTMRECLCPYILNTIVFGASGLVLLSIYRQ